MPVYELTRDYSVDYTVDTGSIDHLLVNRGEVDS